MPQICTPTPTQGLCAAYTNMLVSRNSCGPNTTQNLPNATLNLPNARRWNIGCVGSRVGHVDFMLFVSISFAMSSQRECGFQWNMGFKPIFHCNAKSLALGVRYGHPPNVGDANMLVSRKSCGANVNPKIFVTPNANPKICRCNIGPVGDPRQGAGVGHVNFMLFVFISFALGNQRVPSFQWNMDFIVFPLYCGHRIVTESRIDIFGRSE